MSLLYISLYYERKLDDLILTGFDVCVTDNGTQIIMTTKEDYISICFDEKNATFR